MGFRGLGFRDLGVNGFGVWGLSANSPSSSGKPKMSKLMANNKTQLTHFLTSLCKP